MLENFTKSISNIFKSISGNSKINESNIKKALAEIRVALLEADVNIVIVREFINEVSASALGKTVVYAVDPREQFIKIVNDKLVDILGDKTQSITLKPKDTVSIILLAGLQGSGKTTTAGKLGLLLKNEEDRKVLLGACDVYRPAAIDQLEKVAEQAGVGVFVGDKKNPIKIAKETIKFAKKEGFDTVILDTAGRLHIDKDMMAEIQKISKETRPDEILFVADSMTGQKAASIANEFNNNIEITGVVLTKFDSDTRGGAAFSVKKTIGKPIKFIGISEKLDGLEVFHPDRIASRILGMGDIVSLVEKAEKVYDEEQALKLEKKIRKSEFTLQDYMEQMDQLASIGPLNKVLDMLPGGANLKSQMQNANIDEKILKREKAIIQSMTMKERLNYKLVIGSRKRRIARGCGVSIVEIDKMIKKFQKTRQVMKNMLKKKGNVPGLDNLDIDNFMQ